MYEYMARDSQGKQSQTGVAGKGLQRSTPRKSLSYAGANGHPTPFSPLVQRLSKPALQTKLRINKPGDRFEQEADRMADQVMRAPAPSPPLQAPPGGVLGVQRKCAECEEKEEKMMMRKESGGSGGAIAPAGVGNAVGGSGAPLDGGIRSFMEPRFGYDFGGVRVHTGDRAAESARAVNARAFTVGNNLVFGANEYQPKSPEGRRLIAHELTHVVQQASAGEMIQRAVKTNGGEFDTTTYAPVNVAGGIIGCSVELKFTPNDLVEADHIGLVQTVKTLRSTAVGGPVNDPSYVSNANRDVSLTAGDIGRGVDQLDVVPGTTLPQTSPLYAVGNAQRVDPADPTKTIDTVAATLTDVLPDPVNRWGQHGSRTRKADGTFNPPVDATLNDQPTRRLGFPEQEWKQTFEVAALVLDGPMANTYLGSVEWGWRRDTGALAVLDPNPIRMVKPGAPASDFMDAARLWNSTKFKDATTGTEYSTVDVPVTTVDTGGVAAADRTTRDLLTRLALVQGEIKTLAAGNDKKNKEFELSALHDEVFNRHAKVEVMVKDTEDWTGADEVYVTMTGVSGTRKSGVQDINDNERRTFLIPLSVLVPLGVITTPIAGPLQFDIHDEDSPDADDHIGGVTWNAPFDPLSKDISTGGAVYRISVEFDR